VLEFQQRILGVMPVEPGFTRIRLQPNRCGLTHAQGSVCTPFGLITVAWRVTGATFTLEVAGPKNIPGQVILPDGSTQEFAGGQASYTVTLS
jgi:alpha-L-rhamnosidase